MFKRQREKRKGAEERDPQADRLTMGDVVVLFFYYFLTCHAAISIPWKWVSPHSQEAKLASPEGKSITMLSLSL